MMILRFVPIVSFAQAAYFRAECGQPLDIMFLQDTTGSYFDDLPNIRNQLPRLVSAILAAHPQSSFGVAEFRDKPFFPLANSDDFCYKLDPAGALSTTVSDLYWAYGGLIASGGGDLPEDSFQALINVALDPAVKWSSAGNGAATRVVGNRLLFLVTDAPPHLPGDMAKYNPDSYPDVPQSLPPNSASLVNEDVNYSCSHEDYPSPQQMAEVVKNARMNIMFLTPDYANITAAWKWVNEDLLGQPSFFYQTSKDDSSDFLSVVMRVISEFSKDCETTSTTSTPTTAMTSTPVTNSATDLITSIVSESASASAETPCLPCPPPCLPPCTAQSCCNKDGLIIRVKDQPKEMILDMDF